MPPKTDASEDRCLRRPELGLAKAFPGNDLRGANGHAEADWECAKCHSCQKSALHVSAQDDKLDFLIGVWPRLSEQFQAAIIRLIECPEVAIRLSPRQVQSQRDFNDSVLGVAAIEQLARSLATQCRLIIQCCLREEEWIDADAEFFAIICDGIREWCRNNSPEAVANVADGGS